MEVTFDRKDDSPLSEKERITFYNKMKEVVVIVDYSRRLTNESLKGGFTLPEKGCVLTCASYIPEGCNVVSFRRVNEAKFWPATIVKIDRKKDMAMIKVKEEHINDVNDWKFAHVCTDEVAKIGKEALSICHPSSLAYSFVIGQVSFECRDVKDLRSISIDDLKHLDDSLQVIQINNFQSLDGSFGSPVFGSMGQIIGIYSFKLHSSAFAIHCTAVNGFIGGDQSKEPGQGESSHCDDQSKEPGQGESSHNKMPRQS